MAFFNRPPTDPPAAAEPTPAKPFVETLSDAMLLEQAHFGLAAMMQRIGLFDGHEDPWMPRAIFEVFRRLRERPQ